MKLNIMTTDAKSKGSMNLPKQFDEPVRRDIIKRAVQTLQANARQPYGASPEAGKRSSAYLSKRRRKYRGTYGIGQSRTPRKIMSRSGTRINYTGAFAPQTVGGRRAHPPKAEKNWDRKINEKENRKAIRSALASTVVIDMVKKRGHKAPENFPFIVSDDIENMKKTSELKKVLVALGFKDELERASKKKVRSGKGKLRGRKYKRKKGILFVVSRDCDLAKASKNIPGSDFCVVENVNAELLAPGAEPGRLTVFTESAIKKLSDKELFMSDFKGEKVEPKKETPKPAKNVEPKKEIPKPAVKKAEPKKESEKK